jgi:hypothetical protein
VKRGSDAMLRRYMLAAIQSSLTMSRLADALADLHKRTIAPAGRLLAL